MTKTIRRFHLRALLTAASSLVGLAFAGPGPALAADRYITVSSTTSTENSGLFGFMLPKFTEKTGIEVRVVAVGTGQAIKLARNGDADVLFVHHKPSEEAFVADGFGVKRYDVMYNDFVFIGPKSDPAGIGGKKDVDAALKAIADARALFASRGDNSGTHKKELSLWKAAGVDVAAASGTWYRETGSGMGATLNAASGMGGHTLSDRATWLNFANKGDLQILVEGDPRLFNQYGIILVSRDKHPHVKSDLGQQFVDWILSGEGQRVIGEYTINGQQAFFPNAG
jgi:tungstate transport system substrate-binding protein